MKQDDTHRIVIRMEHTSEQCFFFLKHFSFLRDTLYIKKDVYNIHKNRFLLPKIIQRQINRWSLRVCSKENN